MVRVSKARVSKKQRPPVGSLVAIFAVILIVIVGGVFYFSNSKNSQSGEYSGDISFSYQVTNSPTEKQLESGDVGEIMVDNGNGSIPLIEPTIPYSIFSTTGKIVELNGEELVVDGSGTNFADGSARRLTGAFLETTLTLTKSPVKYYKGKNGIDMLNEGSTVLLMSGENIRGKIEFNLKVVKVLEL